MSTEKGPAGERGAGTCGGQGGGVTKKRKWDPSVKTETWDPRQEFDIVTGGDGFALWKDYGRPTRYIITHGNENPRDIALRDREKNEKRGGRRRRSAKRKKGKGGLVTVLIGGLARRGRDGLDVITAEKQERQKRRLSPSVDLLAQSLGLGSHRAGTVVIQDAEIFENCAGRPD